MRSLIDCDVLLDVGLRREAYFAASEAVVRWCESNPGSGVIAWHTLSNLYYLLRKQVGTEATRNFVSTVLETFAVAPAGTAAAKHALRLTMSDFEDALQVAAAVEAGADCIVTRNVSDYRNSPIPARLPEEFLTLNR